MHSTSCHFKGVKLERVMIFIDGSNFYHGLKENNIRTNINFQKFCDKLCGEKRLIQTHYYNVPLIQSIDPKNYQSQQRFFNMLRKTPYLTLHLGRFAKRNQKFKCPNPSCGENLSEIVIKCPKCLKEENFKLPPFYVEKGIDVNIATDMLSNAFDNTYDTAILVSADGDFVPVVNEVKRLRRRVKNAYFPQSPPTFLSQNCDRPLISLNKDYIKECLLPKHF